MNYVIIDTSEGDARVVCDEYGDYLMFSTPEDAEAYRELMCVLSRSYVLPRPIHPATRRFLSVQKR